MKIVLTNKAQTQLKFLPFLMKERIYKKLKWYESHEDPVVFADKLTEFDSGQYRYRIGDYRITFDIYGDLLVVLKIGHRKEIYR